MARMLDRLHADDRPAAVVVGFRPADPGQYGRILATDGLIDKMVEHKDATEAERAVDLCNSGMLAAAPPICSRCWRGSASDNAAGEYYLPDVVMLAAADGRRSAVIEAEPWEMAGVNSRAELAAGRGRMAAPPPPEGDGRRRHSGRARHGLVRPRHRDRPRQRDRAQCRVRPRRDDRRAGLDPRLQPYRGRDASPTTPRSAPMRGCARAPRSARRRRVGNFVEVKKAQARQGRQGQPPRLSRRCRDRRRRQYRRGHDHLQL